MDRPRVHPATALLAAVLGLVVCLVSWQGVVHMVAGLVAGNPPGGGAGRALWGVWLLGVMALAGTIGALTARVLIVPASKFANVYALATGLIIAACSLRLLPAPLEWLNDIVFRTPAVGGDPLLLAISTALGPSGVAACATWLGSPQPGSLADADPHAVDDLINDAAETAGGALGEHFGARLDD